MGERGIIFSDALVTAIRAGRKTQTRRLQRAPVMGRERPRASEWTRVVLGERLWVRQQWARVETPTPHFVYAADGVRGETQWMPARWMPRSACRTWLEVTDLRHQDLQDITEADIAAEGITTGELGYGVPGVPGSWRPTPQEAFAALWDRLHENPDARWAANPPVVTITFRLLETS